MISHSRRHIPSSYPKSPEPLIKTGVFNRVPRLFFKGLVSFTEFEINLKMRLGHCFFSKKDTLYENTRKNKYENPSQILFYMLDILAPFGSVPQYWYLNKSLADVSDLPCQTLQFPMALNFKAWAFTRFLIPFPKRDVCALSLPVLFPGRLPDTN